MMQNLKRSTGYAALLCCLAVGMAYGASNGEKAKVTGIITGLQWGVLASILG